jgi:hypothetical protein
VASNDRLTALRSECASMALPGLPGLLEPVLLE